MGIKGQAEGYSLLALLLKTRLLVVWVLSEEEESFKRRELSALFSPIVCRPAHTLASHQRPQVS